MKKEDPIIRFRMPTPWQRLVDEEKHGAYADFAAWESWMGRESDMACLSQCTPERSKCFACLMYQWWEDLDTLQRAHLYGLMYQIVDHKQEVAHA